MIGGLSVLPYQERLKRLGFLSLADRRKRADACLVFNILNGSGDLDVDGLFRPQLMQGMNTRANNDPNNLYIDVGRHDYRNQYFTIRAAKFWNSLPMHIKMSQNIGIFKRQLTNYMLGDTYIREIPM